MKETIIGYTGIIISIALLVLVNNAEALEYILVQIEVNR